MSRANDTDPDVSSAVLASRMRWSRYAAKRRLKALEVAGKARRVLRPGGGRPMLVAKASVIAAEVEGFAEKTPVEREVVLLRERLAELEVRVDVIVRRLGSPT